MSNATRILQRIAFIILCIHGSISAGAQQNWFLYIQSENSQPFYVRIGETIYSSSKVGHLVINGLHDSTYRLIIGFPQSQVREHQFTVPVRKKDHGFELKKGDGRSWVLYDWQAEETIRAPRTDSLLFGERKKDDGFASLMASVVNDSAVLYTSIVKADPPKKATTEPATTATDTADIVATKPMNKKTDTVTSDSASMVQKKKIIDSTGKEPVVVRTETAKPDTVKSDTASHAIPANDTVAQVTIPPMQDDKTPPVSKLHEETDKQSKKLVFLDNTIGIKKDTIIVIIPLEKDTSAGDKKTVKPEAAQETQKNNAAQTLMDSVATLKKPDTVAVARTENPKADSSLRKTDTAAVADKEMKKVDTPQKRTDTAAVARAEMKKIDSPAVATKEPGPEKPNGLIMVNSDCVKFASDNDVDKLRIKMMNEKDAGNRIFIAHKAFKNMCFATRQIKGLSELFPNDELRFRFFETAWPFVSDTSQFKNLEETLTDPFFITRFRTLLRRQ